MPTNVKLVTASELERFPKDDRFELLRGQLLPMTPVGWEHGKVVMRLGTLLAGHVRRHDLGEIVTEVGFILTTAPDTVLAPDLAFVRTDRIPASGPRGFWTGPPDLAVEVVSPDDRKAEVQRKVDTYLHHGVMTVVVVDPGDQAVRIHRRLAATVTLHEPDASVDLDDVIAGFHCALREILPG